MIIIGLALIAFIFDITVYCFAEQQLLFCLLGLTALSLFLKEPFYICFLSILLAMETVITHGQWGVCLLYIIPLGISMYAIRQSLALPLWISASIIYVVCLILHLELTNSLVLSTYTIMTICANLVVMNSILKSLIKVD